MKKITFVKPEEMLSANFCNVENIILGANRFEHVNDELHILRFTEQQAKIYKNRDEGFYNKTFCSAGVKLSFKTNSTKLFLKFRVSTKKSTRKYFSIDILVDDIPVDYIDNFSDVDLPAEYANIPLQDGIVSKEINLGGGIKNVCVHLPRMAIVSIMDISIDDNAFIEPIKVKKKMLVFGDSIAQGYDALRPSNHYLARLANKLNAEEINLAIGGEIFFPELVGTDLKINPEYIIVGYGTNDWSKTKKDDFKKRCYKFFEILCEKYLSSNIYVITPIWRKNFEEEKPFGSFFDVEKIIYDITSQYSNIKVISGWDLVPHNEKYFGDLILHPNDKGFECYYNSILKKFL